MAVQERARLYKISRSPHGHARQKTKVNGQPNRERLTRVLKLPMPTPSKTELPKLFHIVNKCRNERPRILICSITNRLESKFIESISTPSKSFTPIRIWKTSEKRMTDTLTNLIQHTEACNRTTIIQLTRHYIIHLMCTTINNTIQQS